MWVGSMPAHSVFYRNRVRYEVPAVDRSVVTGPALEARGEVARRAHIAAGIPPFRSMVAASAAKVTLVESTRDELRGGKRA